MKVVQIITRLDSIGGAQVHLKDLVLELKKRGCLVQVLAGGEGLLLKQLREAGVAVLTIPHLLRPIHPYFDWRAFWEIRGALRELGPDLVATHSSKAGWLGRIAAASLGIPVVFTAHGWAFTEGVSEVKRRVYLIAEKIAGKLANKVITVSHYDEKLCLRYGVLPSAKLSTIHNGIPHLPLHQMEGPHPVPRFVMTARLAPPKNHLFLLQALAQLTDYPWQLDLVGEGPLRRQIEDWLVKNNFSSRVRLLGQRMDIPHILEKAQGFVLISDWEGLPLSILEAMRAGLPVIASDVGGVAELVEEGRNGFLIPRGNLEVLTQRLLLLLNSPELGHKMGQAGREKFERHFTISQMVDNTLKLYQEVLAEQEKEKGKKGF